MRGRALLHLPLALARRLARVARGEGVPDWQQWARAALECHCDEMEDAQRELEAYREARRAVGR